jgi:hypothetical protein
MVEQLLQIPEICSTIEHEGCVDAPVRINATCFPNQRGLESEPAGLGLRIGRHHTTVPEFHARDAARAPPWARNRSAPHRPDRIAASIARRLHSTYPSFSTFRK